MNQEQVSARKGDHAIFERVAAIIEEARGQVVRTVNTAMVHAYWFIGREIVEAEQLGAKRALYGERLIEELAGRLSAQFGKGFTASSLKRMRQFYLAFPTGSALPELVTVRERSLSKATKGATVRHQLTARTTMFPLFPSRLASASPR